MDPNEYSNQLQRKFLELRELVHANIVQLAGSQQHFHTSVKPPHLQQSQKVLLNNPTKGKLDPRWTGPWVVQRYENLTTLKLKKGEKKQVVHINRVQPLLEENTENTEVAGWSPPLFHEDFSEVWILRTAWTITPYNNYQLLKVAALLGLWTTLVTDC